MWHEAERPGGQTLHARRSFIAGSAASLLAAGCTRLPAPRSSIADFRPGLVPIRFARDRLMKVTVCLRPFRPAGPRLEAERIGEKTIVHNYGHGGSGWSLLWGCAAEAAALALATGGRDIAVIGAGVIGLTTALRLVETGAQVTIYAAEFPAETRSARATGVWSPSSRIALADAVDAGFVERWERWARASHAVHQQMVGMAGDPVEYLPQYNLAGGEEPQARASHSFLHLDRRLRGLTPPWRQLEGAANPFPGRNVRSGPTMVFSVTEYADRLMRLFLLRGGRMVRRDFAGREQILALGEKTICNCMGFGAKAIWQDAALVPVRGQINWLLPQAEAHYALYYDAVQVVSRADGIVVQYLGPNEDWGYANAEETPNPAETELALGRMQKIFS